MVTSPTADNFQAVLPAGWHAEVMQVREGWTVRAFNVRYGDATIGPKRKLVPADVEFLRSRVDDVIAPPLTYSQWLAAGERQRFVQPHSDDGQAVEHATVCAHGRAWSKARTFGRALRLLATCIERGDVNAGDVAQALFCTDTYTLPCPVAEASNGGRDVAELYALLADAAEQHGQPFAWDDAAEPEELL